jgi:hypothetical protein
MWVCKKMFTDLWSLKSGFFLWWIKNAPKVFALIPSVGSMEVPFDSDLLWLISKYDKCKGLINAFALRLAFLESFQDSQSCEEAQSTVR